MAELSKRLSTWGGLLQAAETTKPPPLYKFEDDDDRDHNVVPIPISLDKKREILTAMLNQQVEIQGDQARLAQELENLEREINRHQVEFSREMLKLGIRAPMAGEQTD